MAGRLTTAVVGALAVAGSGCGGAPILDAASLERSIETGLLPDLPGAVADVECPAVIVDTASTIRCEASIRDSRISVVAHLSDGAETRLSTDADLIDVDTMASEAAGRLSADLGVDTTVTCPGPPVVVSEAGNIVACEAIDANGGSHPVVLTVVDDQGRWELTIATGAP